MPKLRIQELTGSFYEMGYAHGKAYRDNIRAFTEDRIKLSMSDVWTGRSLSRQAVLDLAEACIPAHQAYAPHLMDELRGLSDATDLSLAELIINNGFTDFIDVVYAEGAKSKPNPPSTVLDDCTAFLVSNDIAENNQGYYGQTWDMHDTATEHVILLNGKPDNAPEFLVFTITGCVGMIGMNEHGIAIGINNLTANDGRVGVTWNFVVRQVLMQDNIYDALSAITDAELAGSHNFMLMDKHGTGYNIEAMPTYHDITPLDDTSIVHTNHCLVPQTIQRQRERPEKSQSNSIARLNLAHDYLQDTPITPEKLMELTRMETICAKSTAPDFVESSGGAIMRPATGDFWAVWGRPAEGDYEHFMI